MSEKFKLSVGSSKLKVEKIEKRDSIGRRIGMRGVVSDEERYNISLRNSKGFNHHLDGFKKTHGDTYDYSKLPEKLFSEQYVTIGCKIHGDFKQKVFKHKQGRGCPKCGKERTKNNITGGRKVLDKRYEKKRDRFNKVTGSILKNDLKKNKEKQYVELYQQGFSLRELEKLFKVSRKTIGKKLRESGLKVKSSADMLKKIHKTDV